MSVHDLMWGDEQCVRTLFKANKNYEKGFQVIIAADVMYCSCLLCAAAVCSMADLPVNATVLRRYEFKAVVALMQTIDLLLAHPSTSEEKVQQQEERRKRIAECLIAHECRPYHTDIYDTEVFQTLIFLSFTRILNVKYCSMVD